MSQKIEIVPITIERHAQVFYDWRRNVEISRHMDSEGPQSFDEHLRWLKSIAQDVTHKRFAVEQGGKPVGTTALVNVNEKHSRADYIPEPRLLKENDRVSPRNVCGAAKYYTERELDFLCGHNKPGMRAVSARIFRVYGCGSRDVVSRWVRSAIANETIELYNEENRFDYIYAGDVAEGLLQLTLSPSAQGVVNLGSGNARQVSELAAGVGAHFPEWFEKIKREGGREAYERSCAAKCGYGRSAIAYARAV